MTPGKPCGRFPTTMLSGGPNAEAVIVAPRAGEYAELVAKLNAARPQPLPVMDDDLLPRSAVWPWQVVALGNLSNNRILGDLYLLERVCCDAKYPGGDGYVLRTVHNPYLNGRNVVEVGASTEAGVARAVDRLTQIVAEQGPALAPLLEVRLPGDRSPPSLSDEQAESYRRRLAEGGLRDVGSLVASLSSAAFRTGDTRSGELLCAGIPRLLEHARERAAEVAGGAGPAETMAWHVVPGHEVNFANELPMVWQAIEDLPVFSDDDRLAMAEALVSLAETSTFALTDFPPTPGYHGNLRCCVASALLGLYVARHYPELEVGRRILHRADRFFGSDTRYWKPMEDASGYAAGTARETLTYVRHRPAWHWFDGGARKRAEYLMRVADNEGRLPGVGDSGSGHARDLVLPLCAWWHRDSRLAWAADRVCPDRDQFRADLPHEPPDDLIGVNVIPLDRWICERPSSEDKGEDCTALDVTLGLPKAYEIAKKAIPYERTFDKLVLRDGLDPGDAYLLLSGFNYGHHSHLDANAICAFAERGHEFLFDQGYMVPQLQEHCTLAITRDGLWQTPPEVSDLVAVADFPSVAHVASALYDYNGVDWTRHIIWRKGRFFGVIDSLRARSEADYGVQAVWRSRGEVRVDGNTMTAVQDDAQLRLVHVSGAHVRQRRCAYEFREQPCGAMYQNVGLRMRPQETAHIENVFWTEQADCPEDRAAREVAPGLVVVRDGEGVTALGVSALSLGEMEVVATTFALSGTFLSAAGIQELSCPGLNLRFEGDVSLEWEFATGAIALEAREDSQCVAANSLLLDGLSASGEMSLSKGRHRLTVGSRPELVKSIESSLDQVWNRRAQPEARKQPPELPIHEIARLESGDTVEALVCGDIDGDGEDEVVVATLNGRVWAFDAEGGERLALTLDGGCNDVTTADVNADGQAEIIAAGRRAEVRCVSGSGAELWRHITTAEGTWYPGLEAPEVIRVYAADLDGDGHAEIIAAVHGMKLLALDGQGQALWRSHFKGRFTTDALLTQLPGEARPSLLIGNCYFAADRHDPDGNILESITMTWHAGPNRLRTGSDPSHNNVVLALGDYMGRIRFAPWQAEAGRFDTSPQNSPVYETGGTVTVLEWIAPTEGAPLWIAGGRSGHVYGFDPRGTMTWWHNLRDIPLLVWLDQEHGEREPALCFLTEGGEVHALSTAGRPVARHTLPGTVVRAALCKGRDGRSRPVAALANGAILRID